MFFGTVIVSGSAGRSVRIADFLHPAYSFFAAFQWVSFRLLLLGETNFYFALRRYTFAFGFGVLSRPQPVSQAFAVRLARATTCVAT